MAIYRFHWTARAVQATIATMLDEIALRAGFQVIGLGEGLLVACNDTLWGQKKIELLRSGQIRCVGPDQ